LFDCSVAVTSRLETDTVTVAISSQQGTLTHFPFFLAESFVLADRIWHGHRTEV